MDQKEGAAPTPFPGAKSPDSIDYGVNFQPKTTEIVDTFSEKFAPCCSAQRKIVKSDLKISLFGEPLVHSHTGKDERAINNLYLSERHRPPGPGCSLTPAARMPPNPVQDSERHRPPGPGCFLTPATPQRVLSTNHFQRPSSSTPEPWIPDSGRNESVHLPPLIDLTFDAKVFLLRHGVTYGLNQPPRSAVPRRRKLEPKFESPAEYDFPDDLPPLVVSDSDTDSDQDNIPDTAFAMRVLDRFLDSTDEQLWRAAKRLQRYLDATADERHR